jgi:threonine/homoserine/homoserine lactone efflux protein
MQEQVAWLLSVIAFAAAMSATPGPNNTMVTASGATWGFNRTLPHLLGISVGFPVMLVAVALGAGELLRANPWLHAALRWAGIGYLLWLAFKIASATPAMAGAEAGGARPMTFVQAALFQWINPKAWIIAVGAVVTYTTGAGGVLLVKSVELAAVFFVATVVATGGWTLVGAGAGRLLRSARALRRFNQGMAALLLSLVPMVRESLGP